MRQMTRRARAVANRREHYLRQLRQASTDRGALWAACTWLVAEAVRAGRTAEATRAVIDLVDALSTTPPATAGNNRAGSNPSPAPV
jgi:hypothetical protein